MTILEIIKKIEENNRQQKMNEEAMKNLREELAKREVKKNKLLIEGRDLKRQQIKVEMADVVKQLKKEWGVESISVDTDPILSYKVNADGESQKYSADEVCNNARGTYLVFNFKAKNGKRVKISRPFNPDAIEKTGRRLRDIVSVECVGQNNGRDYVHISIKEDELKNYIFEGSISSFSGSDQVFIIEAGLNREFEEENAKYE